MSGGVLGQVVDGVSHAVNTALEHPLQTAALVAAAIYAPELLASTGGETATGAGLADASFAGAGGTFDATAAGLSGAGETTAGITGGTADTLASQPSMYSLSTNGTSGLTIPGTVNSAGFSQGLGLQPVFTGAGEGLTGGVGDTILTGSGTLPTGLSSIATDAGSTLAATNPALIDAMAQTAGGTMSTAAQLASAAAALKNAGTLLGSGSSSGGGGGSSGFAQPAGITGGTSGSGQDTTPAYNENLKMMGNYLNPTQSVNTSGIVPSYRSMSSPMSAKRGGEIHDRMGHPEYPKSSLETVFSTRGGSNYVQGKGTGQSDDIDAKLADGEYVFDADIVSALGDGSNKAGAQALDKMREAIRAHKRSAPDTKIPPKARSPLSYLEERNRK
jgi:hypothetical protein